MSYTSPSLLLIANCILIISRITIADHLDCKIPLDLELEISNDDKLIISQAELDVEVKENFLRVNPHPEEDFLEIISKQVILSFRGHLENDNGNRNISSESGRIFEVYYEKLSGQAQKATPNFLNSSYDECHIVLAEIIDESYGSELRGNLLGKIRPLAELCLRNQLCARINSMRFDNVNKSSSVRHERQIEKLSKEVPLKAPFAPVGSVEATFDNQRCEASEMQKTFNTFVDVGLGQVVRLLKNTSREGSIALPDVNKQFPINLAIMKTMAKLQLSGGSLSGLTSLRRRSNAMLSHDGFKFIAAVEVGIDRTHLSYRHYELKYGLGASGMLSGTVSGIAIAINVTADYNKKPCVMTLDELRVTKLGNITFVLTGLGTFLNIVVSAVTQFTTQLMHQNIVNALETNVRGFLQSQLSNVDCERFRP